jgi:hypothetical protein
MHQRKKESKHNGTILLIQFSERIVRETSNVFLILDIQEMDGPPNELRIDAARETKVEEG